MINKIENIEIDLSKKELNEQQLTQYEREHQFYFPKEDRDILKKIPLLYKDTTIIGKFGDELKICRADYIDYKESFRYYEIKKIVGFNENYREILLKEIENIYSQYLDIDEIDKMKEYIYNSDVLLLVDFEYNSKHKDYKERANLKTFPKFHTYIGYDFRESRKEPDIVRITISDRKFIVEKMGKRLKDIVSKIEIPSYNEVKSEEYIRSEEYRKKEREYIIKSNKEFVERKKRWSKSWIFANGNQKEDIDNYQKKLGIKFPKSFLDIQYGGVEGIELPRLRIKEEYREKIYELDGVKIGDFKYLTVGEMEDTCEKFEAEKRGYEREYKDQWDDEDDEGEWDDDGWIPYPENCIPIISVWFGYISLDYREDRENPKVILYVGDSGEIDCEIIELADSFDEFLSYFEEYEKDIPKECTESEIEERVDESIECLIMRNKERIDRRYIENKDKIEVEKEYTTVKGKDATKEELIRRLSFQERYMERLKSNSGENFEITENNSCKRIARDNKTEFPIVRWFPLGNYKDGKDIYYIDRDIYSDIMGERDIVKISERDKMEFCNELSRLHGYEEVYILKDNETIKIKELERGEVKLSEAIYGNTEGYRVSKEKVKDGKLFTIERTRREDWL